MATTGTAMAPMRHAAADTAMTSRRLTKSIMTRSPGPTLWATRSAAMVSDHRCRSANVREVSPKVAYVRSPHTFAAAAVRSPTRSTSTWTSLSVALVHSSDGLSWGDRESET